MSSDPQVSPAQHPDDGQPTRDGRNPVPRSVLRPDGYLLFDGAWRFDLDDGDSGLREDWAGGHEYPGTIGIRVCESTPLPGMTPPEVGEKPQNRPPGGHFDPIDLGTGPRWGTRRPSVHPHRFDSQTLSSTLAF